MPANSNKNFPMHQKVLDEGQSLAVQVHITQDVSKIFGYEVHTCCCVYQLKCIWKSSQVYDNKFIIDPLTITLQFPTSRSDCDYPDVKGEEKTLMSKHSFVSTVLVLY